MKESLKNLQAAFSEVFAVTSYIALASVLAIAAFLFAVWLPNFGLIGEVFSASSAPLAAKLKITIALLGGIGTNFSFLSASYTIAIAILFGVNISMMVYYFKKRKTAFRQAGVATSFAGFASGVAGIGCAACGSFILSAIGASGAIALLPLRGSEFGIISVVLLIVSVALIAKKITNPAVCKI